jgi:hypothetical protein
MQNPGDVCPIESTLFQPKASGADLRGASFTGAVSGREPCAARLGADRGLPASGF